MRARFSQLAAAATVAMFATLAAPSAHADGGEDFLTRYALTRGFRSGQPTAITIPVDEHEVLFLRSGPRDRRQSLWAWDIISSREREVITGAGLLGGAEESLSPEERARRERTRQTASGLTSFSEAARRQARADRIGAIGCSFGGYYAASAVTAAPDVYRAAVAGAPVVDWHDYDTFYTERYLGVPPLDSAAYTRSSVLPKASGLARPLLIVHGTSDDNVYFVNSLRLTDALNRAGRKYEFLPLPGQTHVVSAPEQVRQYYSRALEFLHRELGSEGDTAPPRP